MLFGLLACVWRSRLSITKAPRPTEVTEPFVVLWMLILCGRDIPVIPLTTSPNLFTLDFALVITHAIMPFTVNALDNVLCPLQLDVLLRSVGGATITKQ